MSAFMHSETAFNSIGNQLQILLLGSSMEKHIIEYALGIRASELSYERLDEIVKDFIDALYKQNARSVNRRYGHHGNDGEPETFTYQPHRNKALNTLGLYKLLQSVDYQSNETDDYYSLPETKVLKEIINGLAGYLVSHLPEYQKADWAI